QQLSEQEISDVLDKVVTDTGATSIKDMGKVMAAIKPLVAGKADMGKVSGLIKARLA
ncbi:MAG TPA: GatB/YqeY domain-containing protein, partial [Methylophilaceae bacterium]|nr:GatB/YqeY domain-containing protein [Methylophilaceae bacterium]